MFLQINSTRSDPNAHHSPSLLSAINSTAARTAVMVLIQAERACLQYKRPPVYGFQLYRRPANAVIVHCVHGRTHGGREAPWELKTVNFQGFFR